MSEQPIKDPLHGVTLEQIITYLVDCYGWEKLGKWINIRCFTSNPTVNSSLKLLRKTPWARAKVEHLYLTTKKHKLDRERKTVG
ncbi:MAG: VF530 family protein [Proteobacteria bacterium]|nr:VF530 family protein [Pseudomonadota bacterium]MBU1686631.1 VF530 family protein [Pseudomonadota bacterium]